MIDDEEPDVLGVFVPDEVLVELGILRDVPLAPHDDDDISFDLAVLLSTTDGLARRVGSPSLPGMPQAEKRALLARINAILGIGPLDGRTDGD